MDIFQQNLELFILYILFVINYSAYNYCKILFVKHFYTKYIYSTYNKDI